jgi:hypothetical protein
MLSSILVVFKYIEVLKKKKEKAYNEWGKIHSKLTTEINNKNKQNEPTKKQLDNYISFKDIENKYNTFPEITNKKESLQHLLLSVTLNLKPKRADYGNISILSKEDKLSKTKNYLVLNTKDESFLVLNEFKTSSKYDNIIEQINEQLYNDITKSLKDYPREYLFVNKYNKAYNNNNAYTKFVLRSYEDLFKKNVGVTMLRHIYIHEKIDFNNMTEIELEKEAKLMGHSTNLQRMYKWIIKE